jgi:predicted MFS family arabinose efflux permease
LIAIIAVSFALKLPTTDSSNWRTKLHRVDFLGAAVLVAAVFCFLLGMDRGSNVSWKLPITISSLSVSIALFAAFLYVEVHIAKEPFAPGHIIFDRSLFACYGCNFFGFGAWMAIIFYLPLFFQAADGVSATEAGVRLLPGIISGVCGSLFGGVLMKKTGKYYWVTVWANCQMTIGIMMIFLASGVIGESLPTMIIGMVMTGFGSGISVTTTLIALSKSTTLLILPLKHTSTQLTHLIQSPTLLRKTKP